jgi:hypothetical protein
LALVRSRRAVQTTGFERIAGLLGTLAGAIAMSGPSCGGDVLLPQGPSAHVLEPEAGNAVSSPPDAESPSVDGGLDTDHTMPAPTNQGSSEDASAPPLVDAAFGSGEPMVLGSGPACSPTTAMTVGIKISGSAQWPATAAVAKGTGGFSLWLLSTYDVNSSNQITGTTTTCGMQVPAVTFSAIGDMAMGVPSGQMGLQELVFPATSWNGVPSVNITGLLGGWSVGSSVAIDPVVTLYGLTSASALADGSLQWPSSESAIASGDLTYADGTPYHSGVGLPGILGIYVSSPPYYAPATSLAPNSPRADRVSMVLRTRFRLYGKSVSCTTLSGQAFVDDLNLRVVGCQLAGTDASDGLCTHDQTAFIDVNATQFTPGAGTFETQLLPTGASCADVQSALP